MQYLKTKWKVLLFLLLFGVSLSATILLIQTSLKINNDNSLVLLANQFIHKHISLEAVQGMPLGDISKFNGKFYLYFGPFASMALTPFVFFFGTTFPQVTIGIVSMLLSFIGIYRLATVYKFKKIDSLWLALFFVFSTVVFSAGVINITAYQVEVLGVPLMLFALLEYLTKKRPLLIGIFVGLALLTRATLALGILFFILEWTQKRYSFKQLLIMAIPIAFCGSLLGVYNVARFHSFFETGYLYNITLNNYPLSLNLRDGYMSLSHIPGNLYSFLFMPPEPILKIKDGFVLAYPYLKVNPWGLAIWYTSPLFLLLLTQFKKNKYTVSLLLTILCVSLPLFTYYSVGFAQFGYRYALDFLPFLFLLLIPGIQPTLGKKEIILIALGVLFNCIFMLSSWGLYPLLGIYR